MRRSVEIRNLKQNTFQSYKSKVEKILSLVFAEHNGMKADSQYEQNTLIDICSYKNNFIVFCLICKDTIVVSIYYSLKKGNKSYSY